MHGTVVLVVGPVVGDVVVVVEVLDVVVLVEVLTELVVVLASFGGPEWQWFLSPLPNPGRHGTEVDAPPLFGRGWLPPPVIAHAEAPESTSAVSTETARLNARSDRSITIPSFEEDLA